MTLGHQAEDPPAGQRAAFGVMDARTQAKREGNPVETIGTTVGSHSLWASQSIQQGDLEGTPSLGTPRSKKLAHQPRGATTPARTSGRHGSHEVATSKPLYTRDEQRDATTAPMRRLVEFNADISQMMRLIINTQDVKETDKESRNRKKGKNIPEETQLQGDEHTQPQRESQEAHKRDARAKEHGLGGTGTRRLPAPLDDATAKTVTRSSFQTQVQQHL